MQTQMIDRSNHRLPWPVAVLAKIWPCKWSAQNSRNVRHTKQNSPMKPPTSLNHFAFATKLSTPSPPAYSSCNTSMGSAGPMSA